MTPAGPFTPTLVNFAKLISLDFWNRILFSRSVKGKFRVSETTFTENLVYSFFLIAASKTLPVKIFQSNNEKTNGSDLEILLQFNSGVVKFPCQSKIIYAIQRYGALYHKVGNRLQVDLLLHYASRIGGYPIYMLYNYDSNMPSKLKKVTGGVDQFWGCSIGSAKEIKSTFFGRKTPPTFHDMHPNPCWPFYKLFEALAAYQPEKKISKMLNGFELDKLRKYSVDEIMNDTKFTDLTSPEALGFVDHFDKALMIVEKGFSIKEQADFNPRFRIFFTKENLNLTKLVSLD